LNYNVIESRFSEFSDTDGWKVSDKQSSLTTSVQTKENGIVFSDFNEYPNEDLYYFAPSKFLGNRLASYGGNFSFEFHYEGSSDKKPELLEVRISVSFFFIIIIVFEPTKKSKFLF
jgi:hypothetical protein